MAEEVDLELEKKRRILELFDRLDEMSYYDLLAVPFDSDKKQVKAAYYKLAPEFHPDSYFRKNLGSFKPKIEAIFTRITLAHDVLTARQRRAEYDAYLDQSVRNRSIEDALAQAEQEARAVEEAIERAIRVETPPRRRWSPSRSDPCSRPSSGARSWRGSSRGRASRSSSRRATGTSRATSHRRRRPPTRWRRGGARRRR